MAEDMRVNGFDPSSPVKIDGDLVVDGHHHLGQAQSKKPSWTGTVKIWTGTVQIREGRTPKGMDTNMLTCKTDKTIDLSIGWITGAVITKKGQYNEY